MDPKLISTSFSPLIGIFAKYLIDWMKKSPYFGFINAESPKTTKHLVVLCAVTVMTLMVAFFTGSLNENVLQSFVFLIVDVLTGSGAAVGFHEATEE